MTAPARKVTRAEARSRGCEYCADCRVAGDPHGRVKLWCPHAECPYTELDGVEDYAAESDRAAALAGLKDFFKKGLTPTVGS